MVDKATVTIFLLNVHIFFYPFMYISSKFYTRLVLTKNVKIQSTKCIIITTLILIT